MYRSATCHFCDPLQQKTHKIYRTWKSTRPTGCGSWSLEKKSNTLLLMESERNTKELYCPLVIILLIIIRPDKWNKETLSHKAIGNQASWLKIKPNSKRPGYKLNSFFPSHPLVLFLICVFLSAFSPMDRFLFS